MGGSGLWVVGLGGDLDGLTGFFWGGGVGGAPLYHFLGTSKWEGVIYFEQGANGEVSMHQRGMSQADGGSVRRVSEGAAG